jgi:ribosomal protein S14
MEYIIRHKHDNLVTKKLYQKNDCIKCGSYNMAQFNSSSTECQECGYIQGILQALCVRVNTDANTYKKQNREIKA